MAKPICTSCQHCRIPTNGLGVLAAKCYAPQGVPVGERLAGNTEKETRWEYCAIQRDSRWPLDVLLNACGQRGRWFQPKQGTV